MRINPAVDKLKTLATAARQAGKNEAADALICAAELVTKRLAQCTVEKTLRDEMAMAALQGLLAGDTAHTADQLAARTYQLADAMLEAREA